MNLLDDLMDFLLCVGFPILLFSLFVFGAMWLNGAHACSVYEKQTGRNTEWAGYNCYITLENGKVVTYEELKMRNAAQGE